MDWRRISQKFSIRFAFISSSMAQKLPYGLKGVKASTFSTFPPSLSHSRSHSPALHVWTHWSVLYFIVDVVIVVMNVVFYIKSLCSCLVCTAADLGILYIMYTHREGVYTYNWYYRSNPFILAVQSENFWSMSST